jgi:hypothetical protein
VPEKFAGRFVLAVVLALAAGSASAQAGIEAVQYPAWIERGGESVPLVPGTVLRPRDVIVTGEGAGARVKLAEGSRVKIGERTRVVLERSELVLASGVFRLISSGRSSLEVALRVGPVAVLGRGADVWARASGEHASVVLIAGRVGIGADGHGMVALERALDRYEMPRGGPPSLGRASESQLADWARQAEMPADGAAASPEGRWNVLVGKFESPEDARTLQRNVRAAGFPAEITGGRGLSPYVVLVGGLAGEAEARAAMARLRAVPGSGILTVSERPPNMR